MSKTDPIFNIKNLEAADLRLIEIEDVSEGLSFGRRFKLKASDNSCSEALLLKDIFDDLKKIAKKAKTDGDLSKLEAVNILLDRLDTANTNANTVYDTKGCFYHFLTSISRLFSSGSHSNRISHLQEYVTNQLDILNPSVQTPAEDQLTALKNLPNSNAKFSGLTQLAHELFENGDYELCLETIKANPRYGDEEERFIAEIAESYLANDQVEKSLEAMRTSTKFRNVDTFIAKVADKYFENKEYEKGIETIETVTSLSYLKENFIKKTFDTYINNQDYENAWQLLPKCWSTKITSALLLAEAWSKPDDLEKAHKVAAFIVQEDYLYTPQKQACEDLIKRIALAHCEAGTPDEALELVEPMKIISLRRDDSTLKNSLFEAIADAYINIGEPEEALATVKKISQDFKMQNRIMMKVAEYYANDNKPEKALEEIKKCNGMHFAEEIAELTQKYQDAI